jgi:flavorubredoxin
MDCVRKVADNLYWVGANDHRLALFENIHPLTCGISYNSYLLLDEKTVLFDTADWSVGRQFLENVTAVLAGKPLDYLVINHVEPDHAASVGEVLRHWPQAKVITSPKAAQLLAQFGFSVPAGIDTVHEGDKRCFGQHTVTFLSAPMVHWPEVMVTYDFTNGALFSADAFGSFKALDGKLFSDEMDFEHEWLAEARRYYTNIVGKYGTQVQSLLKKVSKFDVKMICPLHGPVWRKNLSFFLDKYSHWAAYEPEERGVVIVYGSMYGNTESAAQILAAKLADRGVRNMDVFDVSSTHVSYLIADVFRYSHLVLASVTYNLGIFPPMKYFLEDMKALNLQNRTCAVIENGSWACRSGTLIREALGSMKNMRVLPQGVSLVSRMNQKDIPDMDSLADTLAAELGITNQ